MSNPTLTICIPTVVGREAKFNMLYDHIREQIREYGLGKKVEIIVEKDNKEMSIGAKRQKMYERAKGLYSVQIDDDDNVPFEFCKRVIEAIEAEQSDCIGYIEECHFDGRNVGNSLFSKDYPDWIENLNPPVVKNGHICVRVRTPFFKTPIKTEICLKVGVANMRHGEDHEFSRRVLPFLKTETFIPEKMYLYGFVTEGNYWERFGIKR